MINNQLLSEKPTRSAHGYTTTHNGNTNTIETLLSLQQPDI